MGTIDETSAARITALLEALAKPFEGSFDGLTVSEIARAVGRDKSSVSRQLKSLIELGLVERDEFGKHVLGWRVFTLAARAGDRRLLSFAPPVMRQIGRQTEERIHLSIRRQDEVLTIHTEGPMRSVGAAGWVGRTVPLLGTSAGRALMVDDGEDEIRMIFDQYPRLVGGKNLPKSADETIFRVREARAKGYALTIDEHEDGLAAIAAPIRDASGRIVAAINISFPTVRLAGKTEEFSKLIHRAASHLSKSFATSRTGAN